MGCYGWIVCFQIYIGLFQGVSGRYIDPVYNAHRGTTPVVLNSSDPDSLVQPINKTLISQWSCQLYPVTPGIAETVHEMTSLFGGIPSVVIKYNIKLSNYTADDDPLAMNLSHSYKPNIWYRIAGKKGKTLLSLAFNYKILSLGLLAVGVESLDIELRDVPKGCMRGLTEPQKIWLLRNLMLKDFLVNTTESTLLERESVCNRQIRNSGAYGFITHSCCRENYGGQLECEEHDPYGDFWVWTIYCLITLLKVSILLFGPSKLPAAFKGLLVVQPPEYVVKLKKPLEKTIFITNDKISYRVFPPKDGRSGRFHERKPIVPHKFLLDNPEMEGFKHFRECVDMLPKNTPIKVKIDQFDIKVDMKQLIPENSVPVGLKHSIYRALCLCKIREQEPFNDCCDTSIWGRCNESHLDAPWLSFFKKFGQVLISLAIPIPFYIRLYFYNNYEDDELNARREAYSRLGLLMPYRFNLLQYLGPGHGFFVIIYIGYILIVGYNVFFSHSKNGTMTRITKSSFKDMAQISYLRALTFFVRVLIWPYKRYGMFGVLLTPFYLILAIPFILFVFIIYCIPLVYLTWRIIAHAHKNAFTRCPVEDNVIGESEEDINVMSFNVETKDNMKALKRRAHLIWNTVKTSLRLENLESEDAAILDTLPDPHEELTTSRKCMRLMGGFACAFAVYCLMLMIAECAGFWVEVIVYVMMGTIVNASAALKYLTIVLLLVFYSYDCYNSVYNKYLKLNTELFPEVKDRIPNLSEVIALPSELQDNFGLKSKENDEQLEHEEMDNIYTDEESQSLNKSKQNGLAWNINDLILFVDQDDMPRIPRKLFEEICDIQIHGAPGPVHLALLAATGKFFTIIVFLLFVFVVVMAFGDVYQVSGTNQTLATLAGGLVPFLLRQKSKFASHGASGMDSISFRNKVDEVILNFKQTWPMADFRFERVEEEKKPSPAPSMMTEIGENEYGKYTSAPGSEFGSREILNSGSQNTASLPDIAKAFIRNKHLDNVIKLQPVNPALHKFKSSVGKVIHGSTPSVVELEEDELTKSRNDMILDKNADEKKSEYQIPEVDILIDLGAIFEHTPFEEFMMARTGSFKHLPQDGVRVMKSEKIVDMLQQQENRV
ncbi:unnamed protein product [Owenia fusiformis]|uniref:Uncharacterized protein n=1 Tax=Owenia fusiformis TaxID=6347 RepID=A0A8J1Y1L2_OWEFU|nr:unnamed protein product [Owenia fusiformis]